MATYMLAIDIIISLFLLSPHLVSPIRICQTLPQDSMSQSTPWHTAGCLLHASMDQQTPGLRGVQGTLSLT